MADRYTRLHETADVFRCVRKGSGFLPAGHVLPKPEWLEPNDDDQREAAQTGRLPGLSVWDCAGATHESACWWRSRAPADELSFVACVGALVAISREHRRDVAVVSDPRACEAEPRLALVDDAERELLVRAAEAHSLLEGVKRPAGGSNRDHRSFREALSREFQLLPGASAAAV
jgi:hypothetical protein